MATFELGIRTVDNLKTSVTISSDETVTDLRKKILETGFLSEKIKLGFRLVYAGKILKDDYKKLADYGVSDAKQPVIMVPNKPPAPEPAIPANTNDQAQDANGDADADGDSEENDGVQVVELSAEQGLAILREFLQQDPDIVQHLNLDQNRIENDDAYVLGLLAMLFNQVQQPVTELPPDILNEIKLIVGNGFTDDEIKQAYVNSNGNKDLTVNMLFEAQEEDYQF